MQDKINLVGEVQILKNGEVVLEKKNLIVQVGKNFLANAILNTSSSPFVAMAIGSGTNSPTTADTTLQTELARVVFTTSSVAANVVSLSTTFNAGVGTGAIVEAGIFNSSTTGGTMLSHVAFSVINKGTLDTLTVNWTVTVG